MYFTCLCAFVPFLLTCLPFFTCLMCPHIFMCLTYPHFFTRLTCFHIFKYLTCPHFTCVTCLKLTLVNENLSTLSGIFTSLKPVSYYAWVFRFLKRKILITLNAKENSSPNSEKHWINTLNIVLNAFRVYNDGTRIMSIHIFLVPVPSTLSAFSVTIA